MEHRKNRRQQQRNKMLLIAAGVLILLILAIVGVTTGVFGKTGIFRRQKASQSGDGSEGSTSYSSTSSAADSIVYDGKKYAYNDHLTNYLLLGVDTTGSIQDKKEVGHAGQSDSIFLVSYDRVEEKTVGIAIPRDTITQIERFTSDGTSAGFSSDHLNLQYAYGDGRFKSCELTAAAVSRLMSGIPINGYAAINLDSISQLSELLGGVEIVVPDDSLAEKDPAFVKGNTVILDASNTELFIRSRDTSVQQSAIVRMNRQKVFLEAFAEKAAQEQKKDASTVTTIYETMKPQMVTTMCTDVFADLAVAKRSGGVQTIPGESGHEGAYDVYRVDEASLYEMIVSIFYKEVP